MVQAVFFAEAGREVLEKEKNRGDMDGTYNKV